MRYDQFSELHLNFDELESMFSCAASKPSVDTSNAERRTTRKNAVITLLSHKRSFNVSIFLKQFKEGNLPCTFFKLNIFAIEIFLWKSYILMKVCGRNFKVHHKLLKMFEMEMGDFLVLND